MCRYLKSDEDQSRECSEDQQLDDVNDELSQPIGIERHTRHTQLTTTFELSTATPVPLLDINSFLMPSTDEEV